ncbi:hypothetical protein BGX29_008877 [Mortierella sp. GBA35]|nr:hypothetical protein BGX29_008877 [Mortierella sp. GBA35]
MSLPAEKPTVLIVGAGLGGLMLGALLEKSDVPYTIFERASSVKPLGSAMAVGPTLLPIFQQLSIYEEFLTISKQMTYTATYKESLEAYNPSDFSSTEELTGYGMYIVARPKLYDLILKQVPAHKIHFGKRVLNILEKEDKVTVQTADNRCYEGDIIVGADGAYSAVRQRMYETLKGEGKLPKSDQEDLPFSCTCLVGQTKVLDPEQFPIIKEPLCEFRTVLGKDKPYTWIIFTTAQNTLCWMVLHHLDKKASKAAQEQRFRQSENSEWGSCAAQSMCEEVRGFRIPIGGKESTLGDLFDQTPKELISKVMLEEKMFKTWYSGRIVLMGDACHKLHPAGGHGAVTAMHDAIALANLLYAVPSTSSEDVTKIFEEYQTERYPAVLESFKYSQLNSKILERSIFGHVMLFIGTHMPLWLQKLILAKTLRNRYLCGFLKPIESRGTVAPSASPSAEKARANLEKYRQAASAV